MFFHCPSRDGHTQLAYRQLNGSKSVTFLKISTNSADSLRKIPTTRIYIYLKGTVCSCQKILFEKNVHNDFCLCKFDSEVNLLPVLIQKIDIDKIFG